MEKIFTRLYVGRAYIMAVNKNILHAVRYAVMNIKIGNSTKTALPTGVPECHFPKKYSPQRN